MTKVYEVMVTHISGLTDMARWWFVRWTMHLGCPLAYGQQYHLTIYIHETSDTKRIMETLSPESYQQKVSLITQERLDQSSTLTMHRFWSKKAPLVLLKVPTYRCNCKVCRPIDIHMLLPKSLWFCRHRISNNYNLFHLWITVIFGKKNKHLRKLTIFIFRGPYTYKVYS